MKVKTANEAKDLISECGRRADKLVISMTSYEEEAFTMKTSFLKALLERKAEKYVCKIMGEDRASSNRVYQQDSYNTMSREDLNDVRSFSSKKEDSRSFLSKQESSTDDQAVEEIVDALAEYCKLAKMRICDIVCMIVRAEILDAATNKMMAVLLQSTPDSLEGLFTSDARVEKTRNKLEKKKERLRSALDTLKKANLS